VQTAASGSVVVVVVVVRDVVDGNARHDAAVVVGQPVNDARHERSIILIIILATHTHTRARATYMGITLITCHAAH